MPNALSPEGIREAWQPYYATPLTHADTWEIQSTMSQLLTFLSEWASQQSMNTSINHTTKE
jgi:hypothetical protein